MTRIQVAESLIDSTVIAHSGLLAFRTSLLSPVEANSMAEDTEQFIQIRRKGFKAIIVPDVEVEEMIPPSFRLRRIQRDRRALGVVKAIFRNKEVLFNRKFGRYGLVILPMELFIVGISPFTSIAILALTSYLAFQFSPFFLILWAFAGSFLITRSASLLSVIDTQISGFVATTRFLLRNENPLWPKVR